MSKRTEASSVFSASTGVLAPEKLRQIGAALRGPQWQTTFCEELCVTEHTLSSWVAGDVPIPDEVRKKLYFLVCEKVERLTALARSI
jgi:hypothetical protein